MGTVHTNTAGEVTYFTELTPEGVAHISAVFAGLEEADGYIIALMNDENILETGNVYTDRLTTMIENDTVKFYTEAVAATGGKVNGVRIIRNDIVLWKAYFESDSFYISAGQTWTVVEPWIFFAHDTEPVEPDDILTGAGDTPLATP